MKKQHIIGAGIIILVAVIILVLKVNQSALHRELKELTISQLSDVYFYKDYLRDSSGLELPLHDEAELNKLLACIKGLEKSGVSIKSLEILKDVKIRVTIPGKKNLELHVMHSRDYGDMGIVTIGILGPMGSGNGGTYNSDTFIPWLTSLSEQDEFAEIWEY
jgi:hypothetical protein